MNKAASITCGFIHDQGVGSLDYYLGGRGRGFFSKVCAGGSIIFSLNYLEL